MNLTVATDAACAGAHQQEAAWTVRYEFCEELGRGSFGKVYKAFAGTPYPLAIKVQSKDRNCASELGLYAYLASIGAASHTGISQLLDYHEGPTRTWMVFECASTDLFEFCKLHAPLIPMTARNFTFQLLDALCFLHASLVAHQDLKPENVLLSGNGRVVLCDFGHARLFSSAHATCINGRSLTCNYPPIGTPYYNAPEKCLGLQHDPFKADVWSIGICVLIMLHRIHFLWKNGLESKDADETCYRFWLESSATNTDPTANCIAQLSDVPALHAVARGSLCMSACARFAAYELLMELYV